MNINFTNDIIKRFWWLIILITALVIGFTVFFTLQKKPTYSTETTFVVTPRISDLNIDQRFDSIDSLHRRTVIATISRILTSERFKKDVIQTVRKDNKSKPKINLKSTVIPDTNIIKIFVSGYKPETCVSIANEINNQANDIVRRYYDLYTLTRLDRPRLPKNPISPVLEKNVIAATIVGILLGLISAFLLIFIETYKNKKN